MQHTRMQQQARPQARVGAQGLPQARIVRVQATEQQVLQTANIAVKDQGSYTVKGTVRKINEDRLSVQVAKSSGTAGEAFGYAGVFDGHGGFAVAQWLEQNLQERIAKYWRAKQPKEALTDSFLSADRQLLQGKGFMGMGERGVGGSKCGATAAVALLFVDPEDSTKTKLATANIGDARIVLVRGGKAEQLTVDHVPDDENERKRIEKYNPNPKMPLVRYVGGTWRVGGLLALSRAFGDAYLKSSLQFEGLVEGSDGYSSGFGLIAEPHVSVTPLTADDSYLVVASDGLFAEIERGGGGGLDNDTLVELLKSAGATPCSTIAETLSNAAVEMGSTDDVTVVVMRLGQA